MVADRVVLLDEERVEKREADPVVVGEAGEVDAVELRLGLVREHPVVHRELAVLARAELAVALLGRAVDLREVPPVRDGVDEGRRQARLRPVRVRSGMVARTRIGVPVGPLVVLVELDVDVGVGRVLAVAEPVVVLELDPAGGEHVERRRRLELVAQEEAVRDLARVRLHPLRHRLGLGRLVGALRPKRVPALPISGSVGSWCEPS